MTDHNKLIEALKEMCDPPIPDRDVELLKKVIQKLPIKGGDVEVEALPVTENGVYTAEEGKAYNPVTVNVSGGSSELAKDLIERTKTVFDLRDSGATSIGAGAFIMNELLEDVIFPEGITSIGDGAFAACSSLALTSLPESLTSIGESTFTACSSLALTSLPEGLTSIGEEAFKDCSSLALVSLPGGLTSIGDGAFYNCSSLAITSIPEGLTSIIEKLSRTVLLLSPLFSKETSRVLERRLSTAVPESRSILLQTILPSPIMTASSVA